MSDLSKFISDITGRSARKAADAQADLFRTQKSALERQEADIAKQKAAEKKKIEAKQIRSLRRGHRAPGFLEAPTEGAKETLG